MLLHFQPHPFVKRICLLLLLCLPLLLHAQKQESKVIDSMLQKLAQMQEDDTIKAKLLNEIATEYHNVEPIEGIKYGERSLAIAQDLDWKLGVASAESILGLNYQYKSDYPAALDHDYKALKLFDELKNKKGKANLLRNMASVYQYEKLYDKVVAYDEQAAQLFRETGDKDGLSSTTSNLGIFYFSQQQYDKAIAYDLEALKICEEQGNEGSIASNLSNIGNAYMYLRDYASSLDYSFRAMRLCSRLGHIYSYAICVGNIGEAYLAIAKDTGRVQPDNLIPGTKAASLALAVMYLDSAITISKRIDQPDNIIEFSEYLSDAYALKGDYKQALEYYKEYTQLNDSVYSAANSMKIKQADHIHELDLKDRDLQIARLAISKRRNERTLFISGICLLLLIIGIVLRNYNLQKKTNTLLFAEKKRSDDLLLNILPEEVANELKVTGGAAAKYFENVTVLFTDFVNFTEASERMTPAQLIDELHACFKGFDEIISKYNIEKIKTIGDAYLAVSGLPVADAQHAENIVRAAIEINAFMGQRKAHMGDKTFEVRIGMHSGSVVAGIVGVKKFAYDIWGDTVNTASRIEESSQPGKINISQTTYDLVKDKFTCTYRGEIVAKNKGSLKMYWVA